MKKFLKDFINKIWKISITFNLYFISALILAILTKPISSKKKKNILVLAKPIFNENIFFLDFSNIGFSDTEWLKSYEGVYIAGKWTMVLDGGSSQYDPSTDVNNP